MLPWIIYELLLTEEVEVLTGWLQGFGKGKIRKKVEARFLTRLHYISRLNQGQWPPGWTTQLSGYPGIYEFRMEVNNVQYRPLFFFGPGRSQLTFLLVALEVNDAFVPRNAADQSEAARRDILNGRRQIREFQEE